MFTRAETIVALWFLPVLLHIVLPLTVLVFWLLTKPFRKNHQTNPTADRALDGSVTNGYEPFPAAKS